MGLTGKQFYRVSLIAVAAIGLASCGSSSSGGTDAKSAPGQVRGTLRVIGGPAPGVNAAIAGTVTATANDGRTWHQQVTAKQPFAFSLPPGSYSLTGASPAINDGKQICGRGGSPITVQAGGTTKTNVVCDIP
jgi:hypothetical protein